MIYSYRATIRGGGVVTGYIEASSHEEAITSLLKKGFSPIEVKLDFLRTLLPLGPRPRHIALVCSAMAELIAAGFSVVEALNEVKEMAPSQTIARMLDEVRVMVTVMGVELGAALQNVGFPSTMATQVTVGTKSGKLETVLRRLAESYNWKASLIAGLISNLMYPILLLISGVLIILFVLIRVIPKMEPMFSQLKKIPTNVKVVVAVSHFLRREPYLAFGGTFVLLILLFLMRKPIVTFLRDVVVEHQPGSLLAKNPFCALVHNTELADFFESFSLMLEAGYPVEEAIKSASDALNTKVIKEGFEKVVKQLKRGAAISAVISDVVKDRMAVSYVRIGDRTGELSEYSRRAARYYSEKVENSVKRISTILQVLAVLGVMIFLLSIMGSILLSYYKSISLWNG